MPKKSFTDKQADAKQFLERTESRLLTATQSETVFLLGGIAAIRKLALNLNAQTLNALCALKENKAHEAFGYTRFDDFLDQHDHSPMSSQKFYREWELLRLEGNEVYDLLTGLKIAAWTRKALPPGSVKIDGDDVLVGDERIPITDLDRVKQTLKDQADANVRLSREIEAGRKELTRAQKELDKANKRAAEAEAAPPESPDDPLEIALGRLFSAASALEVEVRKFDAARIEAVRDRVTTEWGRAETRLNHALGIISDQDVLVMDILSAGEVTP